MTELIKLLRRDTAASAAAIVVIVGLATMGGFFFFEYVLGYPPCPLCLDQRMAFYVSVPLAALLWLGAGHGAAPKVLLLGFLAITGLMLWNTGLSAFHAGVEWKFWPGPTDCSGPLNKLGSVGGLLNKLQDIRIVRCDEAAWRLFGVSLAGYDVLVSLFLAVVAARGVQAARVRPAEE
jgi:disulfide bond formation protein DsbB